MTRIATKERELYSTVWQSVDSYGDVSPGEKYLPLFLDMVGERRGLVLDAGCGSGKGALALQSAGFDVLMCDLTSEGVRPEARTLPFFEAVLWKPINPQRPHYSVLKGMFETVDFAYCCDVLEHIPPQFTMLVVEQLLRVAPKAFIALSNVPDLNGAWVGQPLHQTVQPFTWWRDSFREIARVVDARDLLMNSVFLLERP